MPENSNDQEQHREEITEIKERVDNLETKVAHLQKQWQLLQRTK
jgi:polyhydroxyalkanoate synthesis regulator phasin